MYVRDRNLLRTPALRLNVLATTFNAWWCLFWFVALSIGLLTLVSADVVDSFRPVVSGLAQLLGLLTLVAWPAWFAFRLGVIKCPCCGERFAAQRLGWTIERRCSSCGFDVRTVSRQGDF